MNGKIGFQDVEFSQNVHKVLKKFGNSNFSHFCIQILFNGADDSFAGVYCIVFHE